MINDLRRDEAHALDSKGGYYVALDEETELWCVFGTESGFAYATYADKLDAELDAEDMNKARR
jgi:hypothetical protein